MPDANSNWDIFLAKCDDLSGPSRLTKEQNNNSYNCYTFQPWLEEWCKPWSIAVATTEADEAIASSDFLKIMGISPQKEPTRVILVRFDHFASSDFNVWLRSCDHKYSYSKH